MGWIKGSGLIQGLRLRVHSGFGLRLRLGVFLGMWWGTSWLLTAKGCVSQLPRMTKILEESRGDERTEKLHTNPNPNPKSLNTKTRNPTPLHKPKKPKALNPLPGVMMRDQDLRMLEVLRLMDKILHDP